MNELKPRIHDDSNGLDYVLVGDYYIPDLRLEEQEERRPIGKWGRMHLRYLKEHRPITYTELTFSGRMRTYLADINEQAQERLELIIEQMKEAEGVTEDMKRRDQMGWVGAMNSIRNRAEEIVLTEIIYQ
ncbi:MAG: TnpV protein [Lachnospiraceae bacterium]|nr:TnpV protein [Lachnospiraceae bacterium]